MVLNSVRATLPDHRFSHEATLRDQQWQCLLPVGFNGEKTQHGEFGACQHNRDKWRRHNIPLQRRCCHGVV